MWSTVSSRAQTSIAAVAFTLLTALFGFNGQATEMGIIVALGAVVLFFLNIEKFERFKGGGIEAEMRSVVAEAHASIDELRAIAATSADAMLTSLMAGNFIEGIKPEVQLELFDQIVKSLNQVGASHEQIESAQKRWRKGVAVIYFRGLTSALEGRFGKKNASIPDDPSKQGVVKDFRALMNYELWEVPQASALRSFIEGRSAMTDDCERVLNDLAAFERSGEIPSRERFCAL